MHNNFYIENPYLNTFFKTLNRNLILKGAKCEFKLLNENIALLHLGETTTYHEFTTTYQSNLAKL